MPSAKRNANIMATMILADAEGLRPKARMAAYPTKAMIKEGPRVLMNIKIAIVRFCISPCSRYDETLNTDGLENPSAVPLLKIPRHAISEALLTAGETGILSDGVIPPG